MKTKMLAMAMSAGVIIGTLTGCSGDSARDTEQGAPSAARIAIIVKNAGNPYNERQMQGFREAAEELGFTPIMRAPAQPTAEAQIQIIEQLITQRVAAIAIAANDYDALQPALARAMRAGIKVLSLDSAVNADSRLVHVNQADPERIGRTLVQAMSEMIGGQGQIAILSATSQASNQNIWIEWMRRELSENHPDINLVRVAYGDDLRDKSVSETEALLLTYPDLKGIISPTTVGVAAAGRVLQDRGLAGQVHLTGLGLPSEMTAYIRNGVSQRIFLWNPIDVGYLAGHTAAALVRDEITGAAGETFEAGRLGDREIITVGEGTEVMLGDPFEFNAENIAEWSTVY